MHPTLRLLPFAAADGPANMALDESLLETAASRGTASLRFYAWTEPTVSLGYFQPATVRHDVPRLAELAWVRRPTGGAAIVHHHELTYSLALPAAKAWHGEPWVCRFHKVLQAVLADRGVSADAVGCDGERELGPVLCFLHQTTGDLLMNGSKVAGSAQRKLRGALLQHGSLLLRRSEFAPALGGMCDLAARDLFTPEKLADLLTVGLAADTGLGIEPGDWTAAERERAAAIRAEKYANPEWNGKR